MRGGNGCHTSTVTNSAERGNENGAAWRGVAYSPFPFDTIALEWVDERRTAMNGLLVDTIPMGLQRGAAMNGM